MDFSHANELLDFYDTHIKQEYFITSL